MNTFSYTLIGNTNDHTFFMPLDGKCLMIHLNGASIIDECPRKTYNRTIEAEDYADAVALLYQKCFDERQEMQSKISSKVGLIKDIEKSISQGNFVTAIEKIAQYAKITSGIEHDRFLLEGNLSNALVEKIGSFTVTCYDDHSVLVKSQKGRYYINKQRQHNGESLLNLFVN